MNPAFKPLSWALLWSVTAGIVTAQQSPPAPPPSVGAPAASEAGNAAAGGPVKAAPKSTAQMDAGEPRANTSPASAGSPRAAPSAGSVPPITTVAPSAAAGALPPERNAVRSASPGRSPGAAGQKAPGAVDRLELGTATVTGDREQPKVMYIVPWKKSDIGDLSGKPMNSLLDEALAPVDREEFRREVAYFDAVNANTPQNGAPYPAAKQGEK